MIQQPNAIHSETFFLHGSIVQPRPPKQNPKQGQIGSMLSGAPCLIPLFMVTSLHCTPAMFGCTFISWYSCITARINGSGTPRFSSISQISTCLNVSKALRTSSLTNTKFLFPKLGLFLDLSERKHQIGTLCLTSCSILICLEISGIWL